MQTHQLFPLTIAQDSISVSEQDRKLMANAINEMRKSNPQQSKNHAWTGDTQGQEFLFSQPLFTSIAAKIAAKVKDYLETLSINSQQLDLYYQRSWATFTQGEQNIALHNHAQSNISFAYYLVKPQNSGGIMFSGKDLQNEITKDIFNRDKYERSLIRETNAHNVKQVIIDAPQDAIIIFPSKASHATMPNKSGKTRISLSGDISIMLKDSNGFEHLMPNFKHWTALD